MSAEPPFIERCRTLLQQSWAEPGAEASRELPAEITDAIHRSINSATRSYRYVLPTQILAKVADHSLDCRCIQVESGLPGAFDARSLCHKVIVPFDRANDRVLGGSPEPYVNNPLRIRSLTEDARSQQRDRAGFEDLLRVTAFAERHPGAAPALLEAVLDAIRKRLRQVAIVYGVPNRASLAAVMSITRSFLSVRSGGARLQCVAAALFAAIGRRFSLFDRVSTASVNAADASTEAVADLECRRGEEIVLAVEVKDSDLTLRAIGDRMPSIRRRGVREFIFLLQGDVVASDASSVAELTARQFATGQNLYVCRLEPFMESCLALLGEPGRRGFLAAVGEQLDETRADLVHRQAWRDALLQL